MSNKIDLTKHWLVAFDTLCSGWETGKDENDQPYLYGSELEAYKEILDNIHCKSYAMTEADIKITDEPRLTDVQEAYVQALIKRGSVADIQAFMDENPELNYYDEFVIRADEYLHNRKLLFDGEKFYVTGTKLLTN